MLPLLLLQVLLEGQLLLLLLLLQDIQTSQKTFKLQLLKHRFHFIQLM